MNKKISLNASYTHSENVVARKLQGEFIIIPVTSDAGAQQDEIFSLNETGQVIWDKLDGKRTVKALIGDLNLEFAGPVVDIQHDVLGVLNELLKRKMIVEA